MCLVGGVAAAVLGCASRGNTPPASESTPSAALARQRQEADTFKAQARQGLIDFLREKPRPPRCEVGYLSGQQLTVLATSEWVERAGLRRGDRIISAEEIPVASLDGRPLPPSAAGPVVPHKVVVARGSRQITLTLPCVVNPEVWLSARRIQESAAVGDWDRCQAAALEYIHSVGFFEALALEFRGRCGFYRTMLRGERFNLDMARDLYEWQVFRLDPLRGLLRGPRSRVPWSVRILPDDAARRALQPRHGERSLRMAGLSTRSTPWASSRPSLSSSVVGADSTGRCCEASASTSTWREISTNGRSFDFERRAMSRAASTRSRNRWSRASPCSGARAIGSMRRISRTSSGARPAAWPRSSPTPSPDRWPLSRHLSVSRHPLLRRRP